MGGGGRVDGGGGAGFLSAILERFSRSAKSI